MSTKVEINGEEVEVFTAAEVQERETTVRTAVEGEYKPKVTELETKLTDAQKAATLRAEEFGQLRRLTDDQKLKLSATELALYENQVTLDDERKKTAASADAAKKSSIEAAIRAQVGVDQKVFDEAKKMYELIGIEDNTPEGITTRVKAAIGALGTTAPDLLAAAGFSSGSFEPPKPANKDSESYADSEAGKAAAADLGIILEAPKK